MDKYTFLDIEVEPAPVELQLSVEMRCREIMKSNNVDDIKRYCTHLVRHKLEQDVFLASMLGRFCLLYTSPSPRDRSISRMPSSA